VLQWHDHRENNEVVEWPIQHENIKSYVSAEICMLHAIQNPASSNAKNEADKLTGGLA
jgi:hypothetical protein